MIRPHHQHVIDKLTERYEPDSRYLALIIGGSVAKGTAGENSDVDVMLVTTPEEYADCRERGDHFLISQDFCDYPDGYIDGKYIDHQFILDCADHGSEPARWAFTGAFVAYSHIPGLEELVKSIPVYPEHQQADKIKSFYSQVAVLPWFAGEAERRQDPFLLNKAAADMALYSARLILAHNKLLFPSYKWLMWQVDRAENKPEAFKQLTQELLAHSSQAAAREVLNCLTDHYGDHGVSTTQALTRFIEDIEWNWRDGRPPLQDC